MAGLALALREGTTQAHRSAERATYIRDLATGRVDRPKYIAQLAAFHAIYSAIERALDTHAAHPIVAKVYERGLHRVAAIEQDLAFHAGPEWRAHLTPSPATARYVDRVRSIADHNAFKQSYREALDTLPVDDALAGRIVDEANVAFALNEALFNELSPPVPVPA